MKQVNQFVLGMMLLMPALGFGQGNTYSRVQINQIFETLNGSKLNKSAYDNNRALDLKDMGSRVLNSVYILDKQAMNQAIDAKVSLQTVDTFAIAQTMVQAGLSKAFIITRDEKYGSSLTIWNGSSYSVLPLIPRPLQP